MARSQEDRSQRGGEERGGSRTSQTDLEGRSIDELRQMAGDLNIEGRNRLDRDQLIQEIQRSQERGEQQKGGQADKSGTGYQASGQEGGRQETGQGGRQETGQSGRQETGQSGRQQGGQQKGGGQKKDDSTRKRQ